MTLHCLSVTEGNALRYSMTADTDTEVTQRIGELRLEAHQFGARCCALGPTRSADGRYRAVVFVDPQN